MSTLNQMQVEGVIYDIEDSVAREEITKLKNNSHEVTAEQIGAVSYDIAQTLTDQQKVQARENIGAQETLTFDITPTADSTNPVTSGGVYAALEGAAPATHASQHATDGSDPISPESIGAAKRIISSPNIADLLEWASAQTQSGAFYVNPSVVTANTPEPGVWFNGFIEVGIAGPGRITLSTNNNEAKTYVNCVSSGAWQGWVMQYSDTVRPKPKDIGAAPALKCVNVTLSAAGWHNFSQTAATPGVLADEAAQLITPTPALASQAAYYDAVVLCTGQAANQLTFTAKKIPTIDLTVYVTIQEVSA